MHEISKYFVSTENQEQCLYNSLGALTGLSVTGRLSNADSADASTKGEAALRGRRVDARMGVDRPFDKKERLWSLHTATVYVDVQL